MDRKEEAEHIKLGLAEALLGLAGALLVPLLLGCCLAVIDWCTWRQHLTPLTPHNFSPASPFSTNLMEVQCFNVLTLRNAGPIALSQTPCQDIQTVFMQVFLFWRSWQWAPVSIQHLSNDPPTCQ